MTTPLDELKTQARRLLKAQPPAAPALRLRECLQLRAQALGFAHFEQARQVLGGGATAGDDQGGFWHAPRCESLLNAWFANLADARAALAGRPGRTLLPYRRQFVVVDPPFLRELGLDPADPAWAEAGHDLAGAYASPAWARLALQRLRAPASSFSPPRRASA